MKKKRNKKRISLIIIGLILAAIISLGIYAGCFIANKLNNINIEEIDTSNLSTNEELYEQVSDSITRKEFENIKTFALFGIDSQDSMIGRSDTIIIVSVNYNNKSVKMISIPRDTYVSVSGHGKTKINHAYAYGGASLALKTINENFGLDITEYVSIDFTGLIHIINKIGGIEMNITKDEMNYINEHSYECGYSITGRATKKVTSYGTVLLDGEQAITHSRNRTTGEGSDFARAEHQRDVLQKIMDKFTKMGTSKLLDMSDTILKEVKTNINVMDYVGKLTDVVLNSSTYFGNITSIQIPSTEYGKGQMINGGYYFVADSEKMKEEMIDYIYKK
ncbi:MAG: LCP family protein [Clostridia bacterium]|nr:LCP family protein [Clostridia bacterium]